MKALQINYIDLPSGGFLINVPLIHIIGLMYTNPINEKKFHQYELSESISELWTATKWKNYEELKNQLNPGFFKVFYEILIIQLEATLFPLLAYSDKTAAILSRGGCSLYPIVLVPGGVSRHLRRHETNKFTVAYVGKGGDLNEVLEKLCTFLIIL